MGNPYVNENPNAWNPPNAYPNPRPTNADGTPRAASWTPPAPPASTSAGEFTIFDFGGRNEFPVPPVRFAQK